MFAFFIFPFRFGVWTRNVLVPSLGSDLGQRTSQARIALPLFALHIPYFLISQFVVSLLIWFYDEYVVVKELSHIIILSLFFAKSHILV